MQNVGGVPIPKPFEGYMALTNPAAAEIGASNFLTETIANDRVGPTTSRCTGRAIH